MDIEDDLLVKPKSRAAPKSKKEWKASQLTKKNLSFQARENMEKRIRTAMEKKLRFKLAKSPSVSLFAAVNILFPGIWILYRNVYFRLLEWYF